MTTANSQNIRLFLGLVKPFCKIMKSGFNHYLNYLFKSFLFESNQKIQAY